jgi:hypothetical protein
MQQAKKSRRLDISVEKKMQQAKKSRRLDITVAIDVWVLIDILV